MIVNQLPALLEREGISIRQLSRLTGVTYTTIWALVHGRRASVQLDVLDAVCAALQVQPGDIYRFVGVDEPATDERAQLPLPAEVATSPAVAKQARRDDWSVWE